MPKGDLSTAKKLGLNDQEYQMILDYLGREPNFEELSIYSVMWSEHCSYKNSIKWLKTLPNEGEQMLVGAGEENAGLVDIGDGWACAFKIESHNHPSAIEPYQGAATGVGGIHRDIFTLGARPIAALNSLRFGELDKKRTQHLLKGVVKGIGDYGNCFGVPTVGGETYFMPCYNQNILVNAMSVGIVRTGETVSAVADGPGNPVFIVGSATGKDGIHGATFASADLNENSSDDLPSVQVGDPFQEKLLLEASLEAIKTGAIIGMQDMGAAGITCSTSEMSAKSGTGMKIDLDRVPTRQGDMKAFEILLSESQERMLIVAKKGEEDKLLEVFDKWDVHCEQIGEITDSGQLEFYKNGEKVADIPAETLVLGGGAPVYDREYSRPKYFDLIDAFNLDQVEESKDPIQAFKTLLGTPNLASKHWISSQYDHTVRGNTLTNEKICDASSVRIKNTNKALAMSVDCNSNYVYADPYKGTMIAVAEAARNLVCSGATPLAITNCLNFGNPYNPEVYYQFVHAIKGMGEACRTFNTPVTGGNVSFYNQTELDKEHIPIFPTPTIGMLGLLEDATTLCGMGWKDEGDIIYMLGTFKQDLGSSEYLRTICGVQHSPCPEFEIKEEENLQKTIMQMIKTGVLNSAHDISDGGLMIALAESSMVSGKACSIHLPETEIRKDALLFGESQSRVIISFSPDKKEQIDQELSKYNQDYIHLGQVQGNSILVDGVNFGDLNELKNIYNQSIEQSLNN